MEKITKKEMLLRQLEHKLNKHVEKREDIINNMILPLETKIIDVEEKISKLKSESDEKTENS